MIQPYTSALTALRQRVDTSIESKECPCTKRCANRKHNHNHYYYQQDYRIYARLSGRNATVNSNTVRQHTKQQQDLHQPQDNRDGYTTQYD
jgi:hypothetical protein